MGGRLRQNPPRGQVQVADVDVILDLSAGPLPAADGATARMLIPVVAWATPIAHVLLCWSAVGVPWLRFYNPRHLN